MLNHVCAQSAHRLDTTETKEHYLKLPSLKQGQISVIAQKLIRHLVASGFDNRAKRLIWCNNQYGVFKTPFGFNFRGQKQCHDRLCPSCQRVRSRKLLQRYGSMAKTLQKPALITLTLKAGGLEKNINRIYENFKKLRRQKIWKHSIAGYVASLEVLPSTSDVKQWHVHIHILADMKYYINKQEMSDAWLDLTGDSMIVDVRLAKKNAVVEVLKYITKLSALQTQEQVVEMAVALAGRRTITTVGTMRGRLTDEELDVPDNTWQYIGKLDDYVKAWESREFLPDTIAIILKAVNSKFLDFSNISLVDKGGGGV